MWHKTALVWVYQVWEGFGEPKGKSLGKEFYVSINKGNWPIGGTICSRLICFGYHHYSGSVHIRGKGAALQRFSV